LFFLLPVGGAIYYFGFVASNQYVAEFRFSVTDTTPAPAAMSTGLLAGMFTGAGSSPTASQNYMVTDYLLSRQAIDDLSAKLDLKEIYSRPTADWWARFDPARPVEYFVRYWQRMVTASYDNMTGLATVKVRAFSAEDAQRIAETMVTLSEQLINNLANRTKQNAIRFAESEVRRAEDRLKDVRKRLTDFRNKYGIVDPTTSIVASNAALTQTLRANLTLFETNRATLIRQGVAPTASPIQTLDSQIRATKEQIKAVETQVGPQSKDAAPLSDVVGQYELLDLERQFGQTMLTSTMQALDQARANAAAQYLYITPYVRPALPEGSLYPQRILSVLGVALVAFLGWMILVLIGRSIREHLG
jgi:capsular polysaccharide transport system permease protein